ncbi:site-specific DNA-methyltransferase [Ilyomonas limi]|uniref:site-specific DNA-methyltransferase (cytosine-N(4)-specific) n=1 Tax=Ilyomonas limi TaxID=2575867 RepID=A0A4U3KSG8_9BACT|nr:DNA methyltransferase [Ilyomonas limi]TKK64404.1 site-specific DNA-methyltransferase [Ilyomonas limi]
MPDAKEIIKGFGTAEGRWARLGPYYAMFPLDFAFEVIENYSKHGDFIIDPFAGRCSSIYAGSVLGRSSLGIEINPVGWLYGTTKLQPAEKEDVIYRLSEIYNKRNYYRRAVERMPQFYRLCYCDEVLKFLLSARKNLDWKCNNVDATLMSIILVYLHGKIGEGLSNQMRMTMSMGMNYSIEWWKKNGLTKAPIINPYSFVLNKIEWRYKKGKPKTYDSAVVFGDSELELQSIVKNAHRNEIKFSLLFTSPPYYSVTDYHKDQWLRLWLLGDNEIPHTSRDKHRRRFVNKEDYYSLLDNVFGLSSQIMADQSTIYVRTDKREYTYNSILEILQKHFPKHLLTTLDKPIASGVRTQTSLYGQTSMKPGEIDIILQRK